MQEEKRKPKDKIHGYSEGEQAEGWRNRRGCERNRVKCGQVICCDP